MIEAGGLAQGDVAALADRLGVGERQLRKLFRQHLGASPIVVAQTHRVLLAKQLIHETSLSMTEVAMASGFGSIRRFNETFQKMFGRPPAALRRDNTAGENSNPVKNYVMLKLPYRAPYDWDSMLVFLAECAIPGVETVSSGRYTRTIALGDERGVLAVEPGEGHSLSVTIRFPHLRALPAIIARVRRVFDLAADPDRIGEHLAEDPILAPLIAARPGLRIPGAWDGFELAVCAVLGQHIAADAATQLVSKLVIARGEAIGINEAGFEGLTHVFPAPERLVKADLTVLGVPHLEAEALSSLAAAVIADPLLFGPHRSLDDAIVRLRALSGVEESTAQYIAMRQLREPDAFPASDMGLLRAMADKDGRRFTPTMLLARAERWRPWRAYAAAHLWALDADRLIPVNAAIARKTLSAVW
jgi:AraC family transcriptional regulator of adaptative response / DNA-3-methyladenine glycosylase II